MNTEQNHRGAISCTPDGETFSAERIRAGELAAAWAGFTWKPGMRWIRLGDPISTGILDSVTVQRLDRSRRIRKWVGRFIPDLDDPATRGWLLKFVRDAWGEPTLTTCFDLDLNLWRVYLPEDYLLDETFARANEAEALLGIGMAAPRRRRL